jgi:flagellar biosynthetic protein FliP
VFITSLTFIPAILLMMTSFTRIIIVFGLLRNALGTLPRRQTRFCWGWRCF